MCTELENAIEAVEKLRTVVWANQPASTHGDNAVALVNLTTLIDACTVDAVGALDASKEHKACGDFTAADHLARRCRAKPETATRYQKLARKLRTMPHTQAAFSAGAISLDHVETLAGANTLKLADLFARDEELLVGYALTRTFRGFVTDVKAWMAIVRPDDAEERAARQDHERTVHLSQTFEGQGRLDGWLSKDGYHEISTELDRHTQRLLQEDWAEARARLGDAATVMDLARTPGQRRHDALREMARASKAHAGIGPEPSIGTTILCDHDTYLTAFARIVAKIRGEDPNQFPYPLQRRCEWANGDPATPEQAVWESLAGWLDVLAVDENGVPLNYSDRQRFFTGRPRDALMIAFPHCTQPGCDIRSVHSEIDHILAVIDGGHTEITNGQPLCKGHNLWKEHLRAAERRRRTQP